MKKTYILWPVLVATSALAVSIDEPAQDSFMDHLTVSGRFGFNIGAKFSSRTALDGGAYNYLDGYFLPDSSGGFNFYTQSFTPPLSQYWGVDGPSQIVPASGSPQQVLMHGLPGGGGLSQSFGDDPQCGIELSYDRELGNHGKWHYGIEAAVNYMNISLSDNPGFSGNAPQFLFSDDFSGFPNGTVQNQLNAPNNGRFLITPGNAGPVIYPTGSTTVPLTLTGHEQFEADIWGFRLGPYLEHPLGKHADFRFIGGLALALIDANASWSQSLTVNGNTSLLSGSGSGSDVLWGYYVGANVSWHLSKRWDLNGGLQYQDIGTYTQAVGSRQAELDLSQSIFLTVGVSYKF